MKPGLLSRQFNFILPSDLPPSHKDSIAKVYYTITIKSKGTLTSKKNKILFYVNNYVNLTHVEEFKVVFNRPLNKNLSIILFF